MSTETKNEYLLLFRGTQWDKGLSPEEIQKVMNQFMGWFERLAQEGKVKAGQPLERQGRMISGKGGRTDGPFVESKEAIAGYFLLHVASLEEAIAIAKQCPTLDFGSAVEVRPIAEMCPTAEKHGIETYVKPLAHA